MSIKLLQAALGHSSNVIVSDLSYDIERRFVEKGIATYSLSGGTKQTKPTVQQGLSEFEQNLLSQVSSFDIVDSEVAVMSKRNQVTGMVDFLCEGNVVGVKRRLRAGRASAIGDSITAPGMGSWFHQLCLYSGGKVRRAVNAGVPGNTTAQMVSRIVTDVPKTVKQDILFVAGGTNDATVLISDADTVKNLIGMYKYGQLIGADCCLVLMPPRSDSTIYRDKIITKRAAVIAAAAEQGLLLIDPFRKFVAADGGWTAGASSDGIHPTTATARAAAIDAWSQLSPHVSDGWDGLHAMSGVPGALITTNDFIYDQNMDGAPDGWGGYPAGGLVTTKKTVAGAIGNIWRMETAGLNGSAVAVAGERIEQRTISGLTLNAGDRIAIVGKVNLRGYDSGIRCHVRCQPNGGSSALALEPTIFSGDLSDSVVWAESVVPAGGSTSILIQFRLVTTGTSTPSVGYVELSQLQIWNLTAMGLA